MLRMTFAGPLTATEFCGMDCVIRLIATASQLSLIASPLSTIILLPSRTFSPMLAGLVRPGLQCGFCRLISCKLEQPDHQYDGGCQE